MRLFGSRSPKRVFLSYSSEQHSLAEDIANALSNENYTVFFDKSGLTAGDDYHEVIRQNIAKSDLLIVLLSSQSVEPNSYVLSELKIAQQLWPSAQGRIIPVIIDSKVNVADLPSYVRSVHILKVAGNPVAEILSELAKTQYRQPLLRTRVVLPLGVALIAVIAAIFYFNAAPAVSVEDLATLHFRPQAQPPASFSGQGPDSQWVNSYTTVTVDPVTVLARGGRGDARVVKQTLTLSLAGQTYKYDWLYFVDIKSNCADWLCRAADAYAYNVASGTASNKSVMFRPEGKQLSWREFYQSIMNDSTSDLVVDLQLTYEVDGPISMNKVVVKRTCNVPLKPYREQFRKTQFNLSSSKYPPFFQPKCSR